MIYTDAEKKEIETLKASITELEEEANVLKIKLRRAEFRIKTMLEKSDLDKSELQARITELSA
jgi:hypothetical protein